MSHNNSEGNTDYLNFIMVISVNYIARIDLSGIISSRFLLVIKTTL